MVQMNSLFLDICFRSLIDNFVFGFPRSSACILSPSFSSNIPLFCSWQLTHKASFINDFSFIWALFSFSFSFRFYFFKLICLFSVWNTKPWKIISTNYICHMPVWMSACWSADPIFIYRGTHVHSHTSFWANNYGYICIYIFNAIKCIYGGSAYSHSQAWMFAKFTESQDLKPSRNCAKTLLAILLYVKYWEFATLHQRLFRKNFDFDVFFFT